MDLFQAMQVFVHVVENHSFTKAATTLSMARSSVTATVQNLEKHLSVRLFNRTTRRVDLTPAGARYYQSVCRIFHDLEQAEQSLLPS